MRQAALLGLAVLLACGGAGCIEDLPWLVPGDAVAGEKAAQEEPGAAATDDETEPVDPPPPPEVQDYTGRVTGDDAYKLFALEAGTRGDAFTVRPLGLTVGGGFRVALLDANQELLRRHSVSWASPLRHVLRADTEVVYLAVAPAYGTVGGDFAVEVNRQRAAEVPAPNPQVVWLNFGPGDDIRVHTRGPLSFPAFSGDLVDPAYAELTAELKASILQAMYVDFAPYNVTIVTSDDGPPPAGCTRVHLGGKDDRLLGLADNIDPYNADPEQTALIYVESFATFRTMHLTAEEMGQMIGNVASHELGHLLGLYHTAAPDDIMDTTGTAWDLADDQSFMVGPLLSSVFPMGYENGPERLGETLGWNPDTLPAAAKADDGASAARKASVRAFVKRAVRCHCGNCLHPDE